ncbi:MAG TPA: Ig-like domain-containing protein [Caldilineaceae bacterium]|nr:Ig-like domain-containing protein [Caldilineaceae bacterium]
MSRLAGYSLQIALCLTVLWALLGLSPAARAQPPITDLFISEYVEGASDNKAIEIFNGTGATIHLATGQYKLRFYFNGSTTPGLTINLTGVMAAGDVYVVVHSHAAPDLRALENQTNGSGWYNGDDAVVLVKGETIIDAIGQIGFDPGTEWGSGLTSTADNTLRRKAGVCAGDANALDAFDPSTEWDGFAQDTFDGIGVHSGCGLTAPAIVSLSPANGAVDVPTNASLSLTFTERVIVSEGWYSVVCSESGDITERLAVSSADQTTFTFTLVAGERLPPGEQCAVNLTGPRIRGEDDHLPAAVAPWRFSTSADCPADGGAPLQGLATPATLWPPNHILVDVKITFNAAVASATLLSVASSEADNGPGDGNTTGDIVIVDDTTVRLRAERAGGGPGRIYTLTYDVTDRCGALHRITVTVTAPANRGQSPSNPENSQAPIDSQTPVDNHTPMDGQTLADSQPAPDNPAPTDSPTLTDETTDATETKAPSGGEPAQPAMRLTYLPGVQR